MSNNTWTVQSPWRALFRKKRVLKVVVLVACGYTLSIGPVALFVKTIGLGPFVLFLPPLSIVYAPIFALARVSPVIQGIIGSYIAWWLSWVPGADMPLPADNLLPGP